MVFLASWEWGQKTNVYCRVLKGGCSRGGGNWGTLRIPREDWGTLENIREDYGNHHPPLRILLVYVNAISIYKPPKGDWMRGCIKKLLATLVG